jgi:hypothetical protein
MADVAYWMDVDSFGLSSAQDAAEGFKSPSRFGSLTV